MTLIHTQNTWMIHTCLFIKFLNSTKLSDSFCFLLYLSNMRSILASERFENFDLKSLFVTSPSLFWSRVEKAVIPDRKYKQ
jgi:hypothetical protein